MAKYIFKNVEELRRAADAYFQWCDNDYIKGKETEQGGAIVTQEYPRPYTLEGLAEYIGVSNWTQFVNDNSKREGFSDELGRIRNKVRANQIEGALAGIYKENLVARINGIAEQIQGSMPPPCVIVKSCND